MFLNNKNKPQDDSQKELAEKQEELQSQKEELTAAIEELVLKNNYLIDALKQLQKRNEELDMLLYRASHDLKSPVASLQGLLNLLGSEDLTESQHQMLEFMDQKTSQMNDILKSLNMLSQAAFEKIAMQRVHLKDTVANTMRDLKYLPNFQSVQIHLDYKGPAVVHADEQALYNILKCLISNSIIFRDPLQEGNIWVSFEVKEKSLMIEVTDDGEGISADIGSQIFNMFFRGSERSHGSGLGLYIVKVVVERIKGDIRWISRPGKTTFQVVLPGQQISD
jgi:signal transduction histidine kinase